MGQGGAIIQHVVKAVTSDSDADWMLASIAAGQELRYGKHEYAALNNSHRDGAWSAAITKSAGKVAPFTCS